MATFVKTATKKIAIWLIRGYQLLISPLLGPRCRFTPSCSQYTMEAISLHGVIKGVWLGGKRLLKCHPLNHGGYDPVPPRHPTNRDN